MNERKILQNYQQKTKCFLSAYETLRSQVPVFHIQTILITFQFNLVNGIDYEITLKTIQGQYIIRLFQLLGTSTYTLRDIQKLTSSTTTDSQKSMTQICIGIIVKLIHFLNKSIRIVLKLATLTQSQPKQHTEGR